MAQDDRTEKPTPKHRERARKKGQIARSADVGGSLVLAGGLFAITLLGPSVVSSAQAAFRSILAEIATPGKALTANGLHSLMEVGLTTLLLTVGPIAAICFGTGLFAGAAQVGFRPAPKALALDFKRINPISGRATCSGPTSSSRRSRLSPRLASSPVSPRWRSFPASPHSPLKSAFPPPTSGWCWGIAGWKSPSTPPSPTS